MDGLETRIIGVFDSLRNFKDEREFRQLIHRISYVDLLIYASDKEYDTAVTMKR